MQGPAQQRKDVACREISLAISTVYISIEKSDLEAFLKVKNVKTCPDRIVENYKKDQTRQVISCSGNLTFETYLACVSLDSCCPGFGQHFNDVQFLDVVSSGMQETWLAEIACRQAEQAHVLLDMHMSLDTSSCNIPKVVFTNKGEGYFGPRPSDEGNDENQDWKASDKQI